KEDAEAHDVLLAIGTGKDLDDPNRFRFFGQESYVKSEREMRALFPDHPDVVAETQRVAELCEFDFEKRYFLPQYPRPAQFASDNDLLVHLARAGAATRYADPLPPAVHERLDYELQVISHTGYAGYFLIVYDIVKAAKDRGIPVGPARGLPRRRRDAACRAGRGGPFYQNDSCRAGPLGDARGGVREVSRAAPARTPGRAGPQDPRARDPHRRAGAPRLGARRGRGDRSRPAHRLRPRLPRAAGSGGDHHPVRHGGAGAGRDAEDRRPRPPHADGDPR